MSRATALALAWTAGVILAFVPVLLGRLMLNRLERRCAPATGAEWSGPLRQACNDLGITRPVRLLVSPERTMPMTWGICRARVLLPLESRRWSEQRRRIVLRHELAHVKRWDCLTHLLAQGARALYWFNPIAWVAVWRMQVERERACDDLVLRLGERGSDYAEQLLAVTAGLRSAAFGAAAMAIARPSLLEGRVREILDPGRNRRAVTAPRVLGAALLAAVFVVPVAALRSAPGAVRAPSNQAQSTAQPDAHPERWGGKPGDPLPEYLKVSSRLRQIDQAIVMYAYNHDQHLPPDLGAVFEYMGDPRAQPGGPLTPAERAKVFLSPDDEKAKAVPENPTREWVNQNSSFTYLGSADLLLSSIPAWGETALLHGDLERGYTTNDGVSRIVPVCFIDTHVDALAKAAAESRVVRSKATLRAVATGDRFPGHVQAIWDLDRIWAAIESYMKEHGGQLPPDLGATLAYVPTDPKRLATPAQKAGIFLSPEAWGATKVPENPSAQWVNQNSSYTYLGGGGILFSSIPVPDRTVLVHGDLKDGFTILDQAGREERVCLISAPHGVSEAAPAEYARSIVEESRKVLEAVRTGGPLPDYHHAMRDTLLIARAVVAYSKDHEGLLPPDLGATLKYVATGMPGAPDAPERARVFLSPRAEKTIDAPPDPTPDWVNRNASYGYLGGPGLSLSQVRKTNAQFLVHGDPGEPYQIAVPGGTMEVVPFAPPSGDVVWSTTPGQIGAQIVEFKKALESVKGAPSERK